MITADGIEPTEVINTGSQNDIQRCHALLVANILTDQCLLIVSGSYHIVGLGRKRLDDNAGALYIRLYTGDAEEDRVPRTDGIVIFLLILTCLG